MEVRSYEVARFEGAKINRDQSVGLQLGSWRGNLMLSDSIKLGTLDGLSGENTCNLVKYRSPERGELERSSDKGDSPNSDLDGRAVVIDRRVELTDVFIASVMIHHLTVVSCVDS